MDPFKLQPSREMTPLEKDAVLYAKTGKLDKLHACLDAGISPNFFEPDNRVSLLMFAAGRGHLPVVEELLRRGADPHHACDWTDDFTALAQAKLAKHKAIVELLKKTMQERPPSPAARKRLERKGLARIPCLIPPTYDIDAILDIDPTDPQAAFRAAAKLWEEIDKLPPGYHFRPDSALLPPELAVRDLLRFDVSMGNGFSVSIWYSGGFQIFFRAVRALRVIQHRRALALVEQVRDIMVAHGAREPSVFPDDLYEHCEVDWDYEIPDMKEFDQKVTALNRPLDDEWLDISHCYGMNQAVSGPENPSLHQGICQYLNAHRDLLRVRKNQH
jgi:hypothetical protein